MHLNCAKRLKSIHHETQFLSLRSNLCLPVAGKQELESFSRQLIDFFNCSEPVVLKNHFYFALVMSANAEWLEDRAQPLANYAKLRAVVGS